MMNQKLFKQILGAVIAVAVVAAVIVGFVVPFRGGGATPATPAGSASVSKQISREKESSKTDEQPSALPSGQSSSVQAQPDGQTQPAGTASSPAQAGSGGEAAAAKEQGGTAANQPANDSNTNQNHTSNTDSTQPQAKTCQMRVRCDNIFKHRENLKPEYVSAVPQDGILFGLSEVSFSDGESVFELLQSAGINVRSERTSMGVYVKSIGGIPEKACGAKSGWMYSVNGKYVNYSMDRCILQPGDILDVYYVCDSSDT